MRVLGVTGAIFILFSDIVGAGVLGLGSDLAVFGWGGVGFVLVFFGLNLFTGLLMGDLNNRHDGCHTYGDLMRAVVGPRTGRVVNIFVNTTIFLSMGAYLLSMADALNGADTSRNWCTPLAGLVIVCILLLPIQLRTLGNIVLVGVVGFLTIAVVIIIPLAWLVMYGPDPALTNRTTSVLSTPDNMTDVGLNNSSSTVAARNSSFFHIFDAIGGFLFAFAGQSICE